MPSMGYISCLWGYACAMMHLAPVGNAYLVSFSYLPPLGTPCIQDSKGQDSRSMCLITWRSHNGFCGAFQLANPLVTPGPIHLSDRYVRVSRPAATDLPEPLMYPDRVSTWNYEVEEPGTPFDKNAQTKDDTFPDPRGGSEKVDPPLGSKIYDHENAELGNPLLDPPEGLGYPRPY